MLRQEGNKLYRRQDKELLLIEPWGKNSLRVRATQRHEFLQVMGTAHCWRRRKRRRRLS